MKGSESRSGECTPNVSTQVDWAPREWFQAQTRSGMEATTSYFGHAKNGYQQFRHKQILKTITHAASDLPRGDLLDLGCATGELTALVGHSLGFSRLVGIDFVPEVLAVGRQRFGDIEFREGALPKIDFPDSSFDFAIASEVLYYLTPDAREVAVDEIARVLRPRGQMLFTAALGPSYFSLEQARELVGRRFSIKEETVLRMGRYHALTMPFYLSRRLGPMLETGETPASEEMQTRFERWRPVLKTLPVGAAISMLSVLAGPILASENLPRMMSGMPLLSGAPTNTIVVGERIP